MVQSTDNAGPEDKSAPTQPQRQEGPQHQPMKVDDSEAISTYSNFCRVHGTPEELIIDFGLLSRPSDAPVDALMIDQRVVLNYYTAKRLAALLQMSVQRHEAAFGVLEMDVQKRLKPGVQ
jgi:hypothetical protein